MVYKLIDNFMDKTNIFKSMILALVITNTLTVIIIKLTINSFYIRALTINSVGTIVGVVFSLLPAQMLYKQLILQRMNLITHYNTDALTGLLSRKPMLDQIQQHIDSIGHNLPSAFIMIDLDHFKSVNDTYGHLAGDEVLTFVGELLLKTVNENCIVGRFGGEEFIVYLHNKSEDYYIEETNKLLKVLDTHYIYKGQKIDITASLGCVIKSCEDADIRTMIYEADKKLLLAKENGRNRIEYQFLSTEGRDYVI